MIVFQHMFLNFYHVDLSHLDLEATEPFFKMYCFWVDISEEAIENFIRRFYHHRLILHLIDDKSSECWVYFNVGRRTFVISILYRVLSLSFQNGGFGEPSTCCSARRQARSRCLWWVSFSSTLATANHVLILTFRREKIAEIGIEE